MARNKLAGIQYMGEAGITRECLDAVIRLIQYDDKITKARILSASDSHCFFLTINSGDLVAIKSGFGSGYSGEGSRGFSYILQLLDTHNVEIDEYKIREDLINRLDNSALTENDIKTINSTKPIRPQRFWQYINDRHFEDKKSGTLWENFRPIVPFAIIDSRITDLAITFWDNPDDRLLIGYRRLEDLIRERIKSNEHGAKLFTQAFLNFNKLHWKGIDKGEQVARANLFINAYSAYRNPRAHKETKADSSEYLSEFLLLNHLYRLEKEVVKT